MTDEARILVSYGNRGMVELADGTQAVCEYRRSVGRPICGDLVSLERSADTLTVASIRERRNEFARANSRQQKQVIAANLDQVLIVIAPRPEPSRDIVDRYLVAVHSLGIQPLIILNKSELMDDCSPSSASPLSHLEDYGRLGYPVLSTSCEGPPGIEALHPALDGRTSILVGQSGVGKSSLVNALLPDLDLQTGALSRVTGKGTHTTTTTIMYHLPCTGRLVDSPGVWEYGLWEMEQQELAAGFIDFHPFLGHCRFNDCRHAGEPSCAVAEAVDGEGIAGWRYESYRRLLDQCVRP